jgi:hypothetical protein
MEGFDQIVHEGYTRGELHAAFSRVQNETNWKLPINKLIMSSGNPVSDIADLKLIAAAIVFYVGAYPIINQVMEANGWIVSSPGYYEIIGA